MTRAQRRITRAQITTKRRREAILGCLRDSGQATTTVELARAAMCSAHTAWHDLVVLETDGLVRAVPSRSGGMRLWALA